MPKNYSSIEDAPTKCPTCGLAVNDKCEEYIEYLCGAVIERDPQTEAITMTDNCDDYRD